MGLVAVGIAGYVGVGLLVGGITVYRVAPPLRVWDSLDYFIAGLCVVMWPMIPIWAIADWIEN
jgi:hypothetical protein